MQQSKEPEEYTTKEIFSNLILSEKKNPKDYVLWYFVYKVKNSDNFFFNWRKIVLQCCVGFCCATMGN